MVLINHNFGSIALTIMCSRLVFCLAENMHVQLSLRFQNNSRLKGLDCDNFSYEQILYIGIRTNNAELGCDCDLQMYLTGRLEIWNSQYDKNNQDISDKVKSFAATTNELRQLEMGVTTKPSGYIHITQKGKTEYWKYFFTQNIRLQVEGGLAWLNCTQTDIRNIEMLPKNDRENGNPVSVISRDTPTTPQNRHPAPDQPTLTSSEHPVSDKFSSTLSHNGDPASEKPLPSSTQSGHPASRKPLPTPSLTEDPASQNPSTFTTQNGHQISEKPLPPTTQTGDPISEKPYQGVPKIGIIVAIILAVVAIIVIIIIVVIICCVRQRRRKSSAKKTQKRHYAAVTVTGNDVTLTESGGMMHNVQTTDHVEYADINPQSLLPKDDTSGQEKATVDASKGLVYADLAFNNNESGRGKKADVEKVQNPVMGEEDVAQLYAKPMKKSK